MKKSIIVGVLFLLTIIIGLSKDNKPTHPTLSSVQLENVEALSASETSTVKLQCGGSIMFECKATCYRCMTIYKAQTHQKAINHQGTCEKCGCKDFAY